MTSGLVRQIRAFRAERVSHVIERSRHVRVRRALGRNLGPSRCRSARMNRRPGRDVLPQPLRGQHAGIGSGKRAIQLHRLHERSRGQECDQRARPERGRSPGSRTCPLPDSGGGKARSQAHEGHDRDHVPRKHGQAPAGDDVGRGREGEQERRAPRHAPDHQRDANKSGQQNRPRDAVPQGDLEVLTPARVERDAVSDGKMPGLAGDIRRELRRIDHWRRVSRSGIQRACRPQRRESRRSAVAFLASNQATP